jgi:DNA repair protein RadC
MGKKVTYKGQTFTFSDSTTDEQIATALKGYEEGLAKDVKKKESSQESILPTKNTTGTTGSPSRSNSLGDLEMAGDPANTPVQKNESPKGLFSLFKSIFTSNDGSEETKQTGKRKQANTDNRTGGQSKVVNPVNSLGDVEPLVEIEKEIALPQSNIINGRAKKEDIDKLKQFAPDRYKELEGLVNGNPLAQTDIVAATNSYFLEQKKLSNRINSQKQTASSYNRASGLGFDFSKGNNEGYVAVLTGNLKRQMDAEISSIDKAYPQKYEVSGAFPGASFPVRDFEKEARIAQVRAKYQNMQNDIGRVHAMETTKDYKDNDKAEVVGERYAKIADPETYSLYLQSGKRSPKAAAKIVKYGMDILNGTANENDAKIADLTESTFNTLHPQEEKERIYHILGAEYYKTKQSNWLLTRPPSIKELDDIASKVLTEDELEFYKSHNRVEEKNRTFGTNVPLSGAINKLGENALTTLASTGATYLDWGQIRGREDQAYDALEGQPISMQNVGEDLGMKTRLDELKKKPVKTFDDIQEINRLNKFVDVKSGVSEFLDSSFGLAGQVLSIAGGTKGIGAVSKGIGLANTTEKLVKAEKAAAAWLGYAQTYDAARQDLLKLNPDATETELTMYGGYIGIINAASENIFRDAKVLEAFNRTVAPEAVSIFNQLNRQGISSATRNELSNKLGKLLLNSKEFGEAYLKNNGQEITEEVATQIGTSVADYFVAPDKFDINEEWGKVKATAYDMAVSGTLIAIPGAMSDFNKGKSSRVTIPMLNRLGYDADLRNDVKDIINQQEQAGLISPQIAAEKHAIVNTLEDIHNTTVRVSNEIRPLSKTENEKITALALQKRQADAKIKSGQYDDFKEFYQKVSDNAKAEINKIVGKELVVDGDYNTMTVDEYNNANPPIQPTGATTNQAPADTTPIDANQLQLDEEKELVDNIESKTKVSSLTSGTEEQPSVESAVIEIGGKTYEGKNHAEAILSAKADGQDISEVDRQAQGQFKLSDGTIIDRAEAKTRFGQDRSELLIPQDENADKANAEYAKETSSRNQEGVIEQQPTSTTQSETAQENDNTNTDSIQVLENEKQSKIDKVNNSKLGEVAKKAQIKRIEAEYADAIGYVNTKSEPINGSPSDNTKKSLNEEGANIGNNAIKNKSSENGENNEAQQTEGQKDVLNENESVGDGNTKPTSFLQELTGNNESVTVSGLTEDARQKQIAKRNKELTLSPEEMVENDLAMMVQTFNDLPNGRLGKGKSDGARLLNKIKNLAKGGKFLIEGGGAAKNIVIKKRLKNGKLGKITLRQKDTGRRSIVPNGKALHERGGSFQREFVRLMDMNLPFDFRNTDGSMFSESQFNSALDDIYNGIPSENAEYVLNHVEKAIETGEIEFGSKSNGYGVIKLDDAIAELEAVVEEDMFKNMTDEEIIVMYANELERIALEEDEQTRFEIEQENLINQEHEQVNNGGAVQKPSSEEQEISNEEGENISSETGSETKADEKEKVDSHIDLSKVEYKQRYPKTHEIVFVDPSKVLDRLGKDDPGYDVQVKSNQIGDRVKKAKEFILNYAKDNRWINPKTGLRSESMKAEFEPSIAQINNGRISFEDGRHRILASKELGLKKVAIELPKGQVEQFKKDFQAGTNVIGAESGVKAKINKDVIIKELDASYKLKPIPETDPMYKQGFRYEGIISYPESLGENGNYSDGNYYKEIPTEQEVIADIKATINYEVEQLNEQEYLSGRDENIKEALGKINKKTQKNNTNAKSEQQTESNTNVEKRNARDSKLKNEIDDAWKDFLGDSGLFTSGGLDPKKIETGTKLIGLYIKQGVYKFSDIAQDAYARFGDKLAEIMDELKAVYSAYYNTTTDEIAMQMDSNVRGISYEKIVGEIEIKETPKEVFTKAIQDRIENGDKLNIIQLRKTANDVGYKYNSDTELQEHTEVAIINLAKAITEESISQDEKFNKIVSLYESQPTISMRSADRIANQQYSTPIPMSFVAGEFINQITPKTILEPSAGNGMMIFNTNHSNVIVNEIDKVRLSNLENKGYKLVTNHDALKPFNIGKVDAVIMNPPFGKSEQQLYGDAYRISGLDPQMVINALNSMKDDGRAAIIIGGHNEYEENGALKKDKAFLNYLYNYYNVSDIINVAGDLYSKQGTSFPTRMIFINGRRMDTSVRRFAPLGTEVNSEAVKTFDDLYNRVKSIQDETIPYTGIPDSNIDGNEQPNNVDGTDNTRGSQKANTTIRKRQRKSDSNIGGLFGNEQFEQRSGTTGSNNEQPSSIEPSKSGSGEEISKGESKPVSRSVPRENPVLIPGRVIGTPRTIDETKEKTEYIPQSNSGKIGSVVPTNMASPLESILSQFGDIDGYVMDRLQYPNKEGLYQALAAEQVDSVALGIYQIENGNALIIGDQTGVGKGRQAAAFIRYGVLNGYKPIFLTEKPHLFSDIYRDMRDIGSGKMNPFIINDKSADSDPSMTDENGAVIYKPLSAASKKSIYAKGEIPNGYDYAVVTYSQLSGSIDKPSAKKEFFASIASNNIIIADESHNAGGAGNTGQFLQNVVPTTKGMVFLSGTFAKRPDNMPIYALKTGMSDANMSSDEMVEAIQKGGVPLQEIMSKGLVDLGQMIRRERDFTGVNIDWETLSNSKESHSKTFDSVIDIFNDLIHFQRNHITPIVEQLNEMLKAEHGVAEKTKGTTDLGISNTPFASKTFNLVRQLLLSLKAEDVAKETIAELKAGRKPVIAIANTMESFLKDMNIQEGDVLGNVDYSLTLKKGLDGLFRYTEKDFAGNPVYKYLSVNDLSEEGKSIYNDLVSKIKEASSGITISPIDVIKKRIKQAGYSVGEMTGRDIELDIQDNGGAIVTKRTDKNKKKLSRDFNSGDLDVLIINQSGSTGISLHASEKFKDKRQRVMLSAQTQLDVNTEIQLRGRIDRTGQLVRGAYRYIISPIPAEQRLIMMFKAKLKSLDANTTSSQKSKTNEIEVVDFLNKYGDEIVTEYLKENRTINDKLLDPLGLDSMSDEAIDELEKVDGASSKVSGRVALLNVVEQEAFYNEVSERYTAHLKYLEDNNANDLEIKVLQLEAEVKDKKVIVAGSNNGNPFSENSWLETVEVNILRKPMTQAEIKSEMDDFMLGKNNQEYKAEKIAKIEKHFEQQILTEENKITLDYQRKEKRIVDVAKKEAVKANASVEQYVKEALDKLNEARDLRIAMSNSKRNNIKTNIIRVVSGLNTGKSYLVPNSVNIGSDTTYSEGIFIGFKMKEKITPSNITAVFATLDGRRKVEVPLSKTQYLNAVIGQSNLGYSQVNLENWDTKTSNKTRRTAHILTGNILQAFAVNKGGQLVTFTTKDGGLRQGILMPENYNPESQKTRVQLIAGLSKLEDGISLLDTSREVEVIPVRGDYELRVPLSRKQGGKYFLDDNLRDLVKNRAFNQVGNRMVAEVSSNRISDVLQYLSVHHNTSIEIDAKELDENTAKYQAETNSDNTVVAEYGTNFQKGVNTDGQAYLSLSDGDYENTNVGNKNNVETVWRESKHLDFTSPIKVKSHKDVAEIFKLLEDASVEHGYAVHIDSKGKHHIQFLSIGSNVGTIVDPKAILQGVNKFGSKKIYLVHNHPSGNLTPSNADLQLTFNIRTLLNKIDVLVDHVILDTYKMEYTYLDSENEVFQYKRGSYKTTKRIKAFIADGQRILEEPVVKVSSSNDVFEYIQQLHYTALPKNAMIVLDVKNKIVGNYVLSSIDNYNEILKAIGASATGRKIIFYGNQNNIEQVNSIKSNISKNGIEVLDYVISSSNGNSVSGMYKSMGDEGLLREHQEKYGTNYPNEVNEPSAKETAFTDYETALEAYKKDSSFDNELALVDAYETAVNTDKNEAKKLEVPEAIKETADEILNSVADKDNMAVPPVGTTGMGSTNPADENSIVHGVTANIREQLGLPEYDKKVLTDEEVESLANKAIQKGYDVYKLIARLGKTKSPPTTVEQKILSKYVYSLKEEIETNPTNEALDKLNKAMNVIEYGRTEAGRLLREGKNEIYITDSLASYLLQEQQSNSVDELTEAQIKKVTKEYEDIKKANDKLQAKIEKLQEELSKKKAERVVKEQQGGAKVTKDFEKERNNIYTSIREKLRAARGNMYSSPVPYLNEILAITPDVARLVKSYVEEGITKLDVIVKNIHDLIKEDSSNITEKDIVDIIAGKYNTKKATKTELQQQLNDLKVEANLVSKLDDLQSGEIPSKENDRVERNKRISELRKQIREEDLYRLQSAKNRLKNEINKLQKDLDEGNFTKEKAEDIVLDQEAIDLKDELIRLKKERAIRLLREEYNNRTKSQKALDMTLEVINVPRTIMASMDFSAPLRQGIVQTVAHPIIAARAMGEMFKQAVSQKRFDRWFYDVQESPLYPLIQESGLYIADPHDLRLSVKEEQFMNNLAEKIPLVGKFIKGSERAYVLFLNKMRHDLFVRGVEVMQAQGKTFNTSENEYKGLASFINNSTGRGKIGFLEPAAPILNSVFFSPRLIASRLNLLNPVYYAKLPSNIRKMAIGDMAKFISFGAALLGLAALAWGCDDDCVECEDCIKVETDPRSSDFAKLKIGNTRYDIWGGFQQYVRLASQLFTGEAKSSTTGRVNKIDGEGLFGKDRADVTGSFFRGKLAPVPATILDVVAGRNIIGEKVTPGMIAERNLLPLIYSDVKEAYNEQGAVSILTVGLPAAFGIGVNTYDPKVEKKSKAAYELEDIKGVGEKSAEKLLEKQIDKAKLSAMSSEAIANLKDKDGDKIFDRRTAYGIKNKLDGIGQGENKVSDMPLEDSEKKYLSDLGVDGVDAKNVKVVLSQLKILRGKTEDKEAKKKYLKIIKEVSKYE